MRRKATVRKQKVNLSRTKKPVVVAVSGGFDPVHVGHARLFQEAKQLGDRLVVILNNDHWLRKKKNFIFMPDYERKELIESIKGVDAVMLSGHRKDSADMSVQKELARLRPHVFANGGDRNVTDAKNRKSSLNADQLMCQKLGIKMVFNVGRGGKVQSSSWLLTGYVEKVKNGKTESR